MSRIFLLGFIALALVSPYFANVYSPEGTKVTRNHPPREGDAADHLTMHPGIWLAFGELSSQDYWRNKARIEHRRFPTPCRPGAVALTSCFADRSGHLVC